MTEIRREIINPSDKATIDFADPEAACYAVTLIGNGMYGIEGDDGLTILGVHPDPEKWWKKRFGHPLSEALGVLGKPRIVSALKSMRLEGKRTSLNDFVGDAHKAAKKIEKTIAVTP